MAQADAVASEVCASTERAARQRTLIRANMHSPLLTGEVIIVRNVSRRGISASTSGKIPRVGEKTVVELPNGRSASGEVRWIHGARFGLALCDDLDLLHLGAHTHRRNDQIGETIGWTVDLRMQLPSKPLNLRRV